VNLLPQPPECWDCRCASPCNHPVDVSKYFITSSQYPLRIQYNEVITTLTQKRQKEKNLKTRIDDKEQKMMKSEWSIRGKKVKETLENLTNDGNIGCCIREK
jgi:hypothetical protein